MKPQVTPFENPVFEGHISAMKAELKRLSNEYRKLQVTPITNIKEYQRKRRELKDGIQAYRENIYPGIKLNLN